MNQFSKKEHTSTAVGGGKKYFKKRPTDKKTFSDDKKPYSGERKSYTDTKKPYSGERKSYTDTKKPYSGEKKSYADTKKPYSDEKKSYADTKKSYSGERKSYTDTKKPYSGEKKSYADTKKPYSGEKKSYADTKKPYSGEKRHIHANELDSADKKLLNTTVGFGDEFEIDDDVEIEELGEEETAKVLAQEANDSTTEVQEKKPFIPHTVSNDSTSKLLSLLGFAARARKLIFGADQCRDAVRRGELLLTVVAADAAPNTKKRLSDACRFYEGELCFTAATTFELSGRVGKTGAIAAVGITDANFVHGITALYQSSETKTSAD